jgi:hypothetical protein
MSIICSSNSRLICSFRCLLKVRTSTCTSLRPRLHRHLFPKETMRVWQKNDGVDYRKEVALREKTISAHATHISRPIHDSIRH